MYANDIELGSTCLFGSSSPERQPAIHNQARTGHEPRFITGKKCGGAGDVCRVPQPSQRRAIEHCFTPLGMSRQVWLVHRRVAAGPKVGKQRVVRQRGRGFLQAADQADAGQHAGHIGRGAQVIGLDARRLRRVGRGNVDAAGAGGRQGLKPKIKPGQGSGRSSGRRGADFGPRHHGGRPHRNPVARPRPRLAPSNPTPIALR